MRGLWALLFLASTACSAGGTDNGAVIARLRACGLVGSGELGPRVLGELYVPNRCYAECLAGARCDTLHRALCRTTIDLLVQCDERCAPECPDGALIGVDDVCNGLAECADGSDERGCPGWTELACNDGTRVWGRRCDGIYSCGDGTDERDCGRPTCGGSTVFESWRCNGYNECPDGSDETGCPTYRCPDGRVLTYRDEDSTPRCNGYSQCRDGSDEMGCAQLQLTCSF